MMMGRRIDNTHVRDRVGNKERLGAKKVSKNIYLRPSEILTFPKSIKRPCQRRQEDDEQAVARDIAEVKKSIVGLFSYSPSPSPFSQFERNHHKSRLATTIDGMKVKVRFLICTFCFHLICRRRMQDIDVLINCFAGEGCWIYCGSSTWFEC